MKRMMVLATVIGLFLVMTAGAYANAGTRMRVSVPFAFYVDKDLVPAGEYVIEMRGLNPFGATASSVVVLKDDGTVVVWTSTMPGTAAVHGKADQLVFNQYGSKYFLAKVECLDQQANLRTAKAEKEMKALMGRPNGTTFIAAK